LKQALTFRNVSSLFAGSMTNKIFGSRLSVALALLFLRAMISSHTQQQWFVVYSKPQREEVAQFHLRQKGVEVFFPRLLLPKSSQKRKLVVPLFPNYIFVRIDLGTQYYSVLWSPGVKNFVSFNDTPAPLDENVAECLLERANPDGIIAAQSDLTVGQEVRIRGGSFDGFVGLLQNVPDAKGRVQVLMKILNRQIKVQLPLHLVAGTWIPQGPIESPRLH
jgi:transcription elongation factor/antiterminator RfaH